MKAKDIHDKTSTEIKKEKRKFQARLNYLTLRIAYVSGIDIRQIPYTIMFCNDVTMVQNRK